MTEGTGQTAKGFGRLTEGTGQTAKGLGRTAEGTGQTAEGTGRRVTLLTLARDLGVSRATVSNAYNRPDQLGAELRERILDRARELGFAGPDPVGRALRRQRVGAVGVLMHEPLAYAFADPASVLILDGLASKLGPDGFALTLLAAGDGKRPDPRLVTDAVVDAFVVHSIGAGHPFVSAAAERGLPMVVLDQPLLPGVPRVAIGDADGARAAMAHLLSLGHRRVAVLSLPILADGVTGPASQERQAVSTFPVTAARLRGAAGAVAAAGLRWADVAVYECPRNDLQVAIAAAAGLLTVANPPTAILALSDQLALGALHAAKALGLAVPAQLSVTGFDDIPAAATADPPLTTIRQPLRERGRAVGTLLAALIVGVAADPLPPVTEFGTELVVRASTAPVP
jgi:DNA-binding LacI/PurR family transcriptional regulator